VLEFPCIIHFVYFCYFSMFCTSTLIWNSSYFQFLLSLYLIWAVHMFWTDKFSGIAGVLLVFFKVVLQYQYQGFSIVLQYKTATLVHPCFLAVGITKQSTKIREESNFIYNPSWFKYFQINVCSKYKKVKIISERMC
jgi:hypothetical protein